MTALTRRANSALVRRADRADRRRQQASRRCGGRNRRILGRKMTGLGRPLGVSGLPELMKGPAFSTTQGAFDLPAGGWLTKVASAEGESSAGRRGIRRSSAKVGKVAQGQFLNGGRDPKKSAVRRCGEVTIRRGNNDHQSSKADIKPELKPRYYRCTASGAAAANAVNKANDQLGPAGRRFRRTAQHPRPGADDVQGPSG